MSEKLDRIVFLKKFKEEAGEHIKYLSQALLGLGEEPENKNVILEDMIRRCHTLKGSAKMMGVEKVGILAHNLEEILGKIKGEELKPTDDIVDLIFDCFDAVLKIINQAIFPEEGEEDISYLLQRLADVGEKKYVPPVRTEKAFPDYFGLKFEETVRVDMAKLDSLAALAGEMVIFQIKAEQRVNEIKNILYQARTVNNLWLPIKEKLGGQISKEHHQEYEKEFNLLENYQVKLKNSVVDLVHNLSEDFMHLKYNVGELYSQILEIRMLPLASIFGYYPRAIRDMAREFDKQIKVIIKGGQTELDKKMIEQLNAPLIHILRNAVDHGIETKDERVKSGKNSTGTISILAYQEGNSIIIEVEDDGGGIDVEKLKESAVRKGIIDQVRAGKMSYEEALALIFETGLSTSRIVTDTSGRGVGLDVVKESIASLKGQIKINSQLNKGTKLSLILPVTLTTFSALLVKAGICLFAIPSSAIEEVIYIRPDLIHTVEGKEAVSLNYAIVPLMKLSAVLCIEEDPAKTDGKFPVVIVSYAHQRIGFMVDALIAEQEIVMKSLGSHLKKIKGIIGATIIGSGDVVPIVNIPEVVSHAREAKVGRVITEAKLTEVEPTILVVEDSLTTRELMKSILEHNGYRVEAAQDGMEALEILSVRKIDVVVTDIQMPRMDGFLLTKNIKKNKIWKSIPVIIITAMEKEEDKKRGIQVGADAFILKSTFDQTNLISTIKRLAG